MLKTVLLLSAVGTALVLALPSRAWCVPEISAGPAQSSLKIRSVEFEPIGSGKNVVYINMSNPTAKQKSCLVVIQTDDRIGWEDHYTTTITMNAGEAKRVRCVFSFIGAISGDSSIRLRFYERASAVNCDYSQYFQQQLFGRDDVRLRAPAKTKPLPKSDIRAVEVQRAFKSFQQLIRQGDYGKIWRSVFSKDYQDTSFRSLDIFEKTMAGSYSICLAYWDPDTLLGMYPAAVGCSSNTIVLSVTDGKETWQVSFVLSESGWRIDGIGGYAPAILLQPVDANNWERPLLAKTQRHDTEHLEIRYFKNSTAERELTSIAKTKERGYAGIVESLGLSGLPSGWKIRYVFFEDMKTKFLDTGTIGMGCLAFSGDMQQLTISIFEVCNKKERLDSYHETTHILMVPYGQPPAVLAEGVATYMSERLGGTPALRYLGGEDRTLYARVRGFKKKGEWISLKELLTYTNIGTQGSRTGLAYVEAGAFVKYLIETFGKDRFFEAFKKLENSEDPKICRQNQEELERIYGCALQKLEGDWERAFLSKSR